MSKIGMVVVVFLLILPLVWLYVVDTYNNQIESDTVHVSHTFEITPKKGTTHLEVHPSIKIRYSAKFFGLVRREYEQKKRMIQVTGTTPVQVTIEGDVPNKAIWKAKAFVYFWDQTEPTKTHTIGYTDYRTPWYHLFNKDLLMGE